MSSRLSVLQAYTYLARRSGKGYTQVSQRKILEILMKFYECDISRRTLNRILNELESEGMIRRIRRHKKAPDGKIQFHTTLVVLKKKALQYLTSIARWFKKCRWVLYTHKGAEREIQKRELQLRMIETARRLFRK
jgi:DNA-binding HxlR family transcriptional regulator